MSSRASGEPAVVVEGVGKRYLRGEARRAHTLASERIEHALTAPLRRLRGRSAEPALPPLPQEERAFWALRDVSFEVRYGEAVGIIGRNGAGKSTMLKILSRITPPTEGRITMYGRASALLEVGTGFHPELTGRENVFLNGSLLGMSRAEIARSFDEIVEFSGVERFLDTPVKRYSSGMYVRLAFSVAAHLDPEVLIIDEVLAVGDMEFQKRCLDKMKLEAREGRAIVFVSHDMRSISRLCDRALLLENGLVIAESNPQETVGEYVETVEPVHPEQVGGTSLIPADASRDGTGEGHLVEVVLSDRDGAPSAEINFGEPFRITALFEFGEAVGDVAFEMGICRLDGERIVTVHSIDGDGRWVDVRPGRHEVTATIEHLTLLPGEFSLTVGAHRLDGLTVDFVERVLRFTARNGDEGEDRWVWGSVRGYVRPDSRWSGSVSVGSPALGGRDGT